MASLNDDEIVTRQREGTERWETGDTDTVDTDADDVDGDDVDTDDPS